MGPSVGSIAVATFMKDLSQVNRELINSVTGNPPFPMH